MAERSSIPLRAVDMRQGLAPQAMVTALAVELERLALRYERERDPRCVFARSYAGMTRVLAASLPRSDFADPAWVAQFAVTFADYYFRAVRDYDAGTLVRGAWSTVFQAGEQGRTSVLEDLLLGMTAHIVNDLPLALCEVGMTTPRGESRIADYHTINEVLAHAIEGIQSDISRRYDRFLGVLDHCAESYDEILTGYGLRISRAGAWYNAQRLLDPVSRGAALSAIARSPEITLLELLEPPILSLRCALRLARLMSRKARRWPGAARPGESAFQAVAR